MNAANHSCCHTPSIWTPLFKPVLRWVVPAMLVAVLTCPQADAEAVFPPTVSSSAATTITDTSAVAAGNITELGDSVVTARGVVYSVKSLNANPEIGGTSVVVAPASGSANTAGAFTVNLAGLDPATEYSFKAYATNTAGTSYGSALTFITLIKPTIIDPTTTAIDATTVTLGANVTNDGLSAITSRGVVISPTSLNNDPAVGGASVTQWTATGTIGVFTVDVTGLTPGTGYSFKAYATNGVGTTYTSVSTFNTLTVPSLAAIPTSTLITTNSATLGGDVTSDGFTPITERGIVYSITSANGAPQIGGSDVTKITASTGAIAPASFIGTYRAASATGPFTINATGLANGTAYTFCAYATNSEGTTYSGFGTFQTLAATPVLTLPTKTSIVTDAVTTVSSAKLGGNVATPGSEVIERGVVYSLTSADSDPFVGDSDVLASINANTAGTTGAFTVNIGNLLPYTSYTFKAYVKNSAGVVGYTVVDAFITPAVAPVVKSGATVSSVTSTSALFGGNVTKTGGRTLDEVGVVYSVTTTNDNPELNGEGVSKVNASAATGVFSIPVTGLKPNTQYSFKAFAKNAVGASYSSVSIFTTLSEVPTVTTPSNSSVTTNSAVLGGNVSKDGGLAITERGVVYALTSQNSNPQLGGGNVTKMTSSAGTGIFSVSVAGLEPGKKYSFAAYATNAEGTGYSAVTTFTTVSTAPTIATPSIDAIKSSQATIGASVTKDNGSAVIERGVVYSLSSENDKPMIGGAFVKKSTSAGTTGDFTVTITGLELATKYSFAVYAKNSVGTTYSSVFAFTTSAKTPTVVEPAANSVAATTASLGGRVSADGGVDIEARGVVYSILAKNPDPRIGGVYVNDESTTGSTGKFSVSAAKLQPSTEYVFRAYATNSTGTSYTSAERFTTLPARPTVTNPSISSLGSTIAKLGGKVTKTNGEEITERGVVYSLTSVNNSPKANGKGVRKVNVAPGNGEFSVLVSKLKPGTNYTFAAYAKNKVGISYTPFDAFTTKTDLPVVILARKDQVLSQSAILGGKVASDGGLEIMERGVVYSNIDAKPAKGAPAVSSKNISGSTGYFSIPVDGLLPNTRYHFRAYAINKRGISYSAANSFTTQELAAKSKAVVTGLSATREGAVSGTPETCYTVGEDGLKYLTIVVGKSSCEGLGSHVVEVSGNLTEWFSGSKHTTVLCDGTNILKIRDNTPLTLGVKRYIRLKP